MEQEQEGRVKAMDKLTPRERDNIYLASVVDQQIDLYLKEDVVLDNIMKFYLNHIKKVVAEIEAKYIGNLKISDKESRRAQNRVFKMAEVVDIKKEGIRLALTKADSQFIYTVSTIMKVFDQAVERSKNIDSQLKYWFRSMLYDWYEFEQYVIRGCVSKYE